VNVAFLDAKLQALYVKGKGGLAQKFPSEVVEKFFSVMEIATSVDNTAQLRQFRSLNYEKLKGDRKGQHSLRLNDQFRLIVAESHDEDGQLLVIVEITDYH